MQELASAAATLPSRPVEVRTAASQLSDVWYAGWWLGRQHVHAEASQEEENWR